MLNCVKLYRNPNNFQTCLSFGVNEGGALDSFFRITVHSPTVISQISTCNVFLTSSAIAADPHTYKCALLWSIRSQIIE